MARDTSSKYTGKVKIGAGPVPIQQWKAPLKRSDVLDASGFKGGGRMRGERGDPKSRG